MALSVLVGPRQWDAANYVLQKVEDPDQFYITDDALNAYVEPTNEEFSRAIPLNAVTGVLSADGTFTSPLTTVANQQRYILSVANGFPSAPISISQVSYVFANTTVSAASEWSLVQLNYGSSATIIQVAVDSPTQRIIRDYNLDEMQRFNRGYFDFVTDSATSLPALDLYPIPTTSGLPIVVKYLAEHPIVTNPTTGTVTLATIPSTRARDWGKLFFLEVMDQESDRLMKNKMVKAGLIESQVDSKTMEARINRIREEVNASLGHYVGAGAISN